MEADNGSEMETIIHLFEFVLIEIGTVITEVFELYVARSLISDNNLICRGLSLLN